MIDFITLALSKKYTNKAIAESAVVWFKYIIADSLPLSGEEQTIYFIKNNSSWKDNYYDEYLWIPDTNNFEKIGSTEIPAALPNPNALTFTGAVNASYDGSAPLSVKIPTVDDVLAALPAWEGGSY